MGESWPVWAKLMVEEDENETEVEPTGSEPNHGEARLAD
jgi:hypothetical protein